MPLSYLPIMYLDCCWRNQDGAVVRNFLCHIMSRHFVFSRLFAPRSRRRQRGDSVYSASTRRCTATDVAWNMTWLHYRKTNKQRCSETYRQTDRRRDRRTEHSAWHDARWIDRRNQWYFSYKPISVSVTFQISHFFIYLVLVNHIK